jgi:Recombinase
LKSTIPLGYDIKDRKLVVNDEEAERVRLIFRQYLVLGCVSKLRADLDRWGIRSKLRVLASGRVLGGCSFGRGSLYHLLKNRICRGEVAHKGITYPVEHKAIVGEELWNVVQARLTTNRITRRKSRIETGALLTGLTRGVGDREYCAPAWQQAERDMPDPQLGHGPASTRQRSLGPSRDLHDADARQKLRGIAAGYERLAQRIEQRSADNAVDGE